MNNGDRFVRPGLLAAAVVLTVTACTTQPESAAAPAAASPGPAAATSFGPDRFGALTVAMSEKDALATGELQTSPVSTVLGRNVYSFPGGPRPDPKRMAADEKIEKAVVRADENPGTSAADSADDAQAYADSAGRIAERMEAFLSAGGAVFEKGRLTWLAAPEGAATEAGIKRGSTVAELTAAYGDKGLTKRDETGYQLPVAGRPGWRMLFEVDGDQVRYLSLAD